MGMYSTLTRLKSLCEKINEIMSLAVSGVVELEVGGVEDEVGKGGVEDEVGKGGVEDEAGGTKEEGIKVEEDLTAEELIVDWMNSKHSKVMQNSAGIEMNVGVNPSCLSFCSVLRSRQSNVSVPIYVSIGM
uniref:Uncharacterized protein n=1 Tax=Amphimedon queenslandica TaxID=400682 RepID=A0A1X7U4Y3_AMPQE